LEIIWAYKRCRFATGRNTNQNRSIDSSAFLQIAFRISCVSTHAKNVFILEQKALWKAKSRSGEIRKIERRTNFWKLRPREAEYLASPMTERPAG
jgi:hypothetical protein